MADDDYSSSGRSRSWLYVLLFLVALVILAGLAGGFYLNHSRIARLENAQKQMKGESNTPAPTTISLKDINDPTVRLALIHSYAAALNPLLTTARQKDLETIIVYVNGNPKVLVTKNPDLPKDVALAVSNLKTSVKNLKAAGTVIKQRTDNVSYAQGDTINLTGTISFVADDPELGGSIFSLTDSESGEIYYLHFNDANSANIKSTMLDKEVTLTAKVTSKVTEPLAFQVTKGPVLTSSLTPVSTKSATTTATPTP